MKNLKKHNLLTNLILIVTTLLSVGKVYAEAVVEQTGTLSAPPTVSIQKTASSEIGSINPRNGVNSGNLSASFYLQTNVYDDTRDFIIGSKVQILNGTEVTGYTNNGELIFTNTSSLPSFDSVENLKRGGDDNPNAIAYQVNFTIPNTMSISYDKSKETNEGFGCYVLLVNETPEGTITQTVLPTPVSNSFSLKDEAGSYKSTVYFTVVNK